jgi:type IV pilus assembly protein PilW
MDMKIYMPTNQCCKNKKQLGLSLIELMISIALGLVILLAVSTLFVQQSRTRSELDKSNRMIESGRYAIGVLSDQLKVSGYYGNYALPSGNPTLTPEPCNMATLTDASTSLNVLRHHVQGYSSGSSTAAIPISAQLGACGFASSLLKPGSDILVVRRVSTATPILVVSKVAATTYLQTSNCTNDTAAYEIALGTATFSNLHERDCGAVASLRPFIVQLYFISPFNVAGDGVPTLKRRELDPTTNTFVTTPLVEGIEFMKVAYGLDTNADGAADSYTSLPASPAQWKQVVTVSIDLIARNLEMTTGFTDTKTYQLGSAGIFGPFNDSYKRHVFSQVVRLVNPSIRR